MPDLHQMLLQFIGIMNLISDASMPKEAILAFNVTQKYTNN